MAAVAGPCQGGGRPGGLATTNEILLAAIALGLWVNAAVSYVRPAAAQDGTSSLTGAIGAISHQVGNLNVRVQDTQTDVVRLLVASSHRAQCGPGQ